jgi:hypothetical protein
MEVHLMKSAFLSPGVELTHALKGKIVFSSVKTKWNNILFVIPK